jgi:hypothetical protein
MRQHEGNIAERKSALRHPHRPATTGAGSEVGDDVGRERVADELCAEDDSVCSGEDGLDVGRGTEVTETLLTDNEGGRQTEQETETSKNSLTRGHGYQSKGVWGGSLAGYCYTFWKEVGAFWRMDPYAPTEKTDRRDALSDNFSRQR